MGFEDNLRALVGESARMRHLLRLVDKIGPARWPVLLIGETGTGKEVVARRLHAANPSGPFVTIDCSAMVGPLMESELFGHTKGSFTGAHQAKQGLVEMADGGTAFFDEIGELPLDLQSKLLRVLQEKEFRQVGGTVSRRSDFRIIAATNRDLAKEAAAGNFRSDLYYRLNVVTMRLAPLRERREDVPALVQHFLVQYGKGHRLTPEVLDALCAYDWPGNVRELENSVQHMMAVNTGPLIQTTDLPSSLQHFLKERKQPAMTAAAGAGGARFSPGALPYLSPVTALGEAGPRSPGAYPPAEPPSRSYSTTAGAIPLGLPDQPIVPLSELERLAILRALQYTRGDRMAAATLLGIGRTTLYRKLKEYGEG